jgi:hypothetical protein
VVAVVDDEVEGGVVAEVGLDRDGAVVAGAWVDGAAVEAVVVGVVVAGGSVSASATVCVIHSPTVPATKAAALRTAVATRDRAAGWRRRRRPGGGVEVPVGEDHGGWTSPALTGTSLTGRAGSNL